MEIFVINLDERPQRLAHMTGELAAAGLSFERFSAIDGRALVAREGAHPRLSPGAWGCLSSHLGVCARIAAGEASHGLVLEDDLHLAASIGDLLAAPDAWIPADADLIKLESFEGETHLLRRPAATYGRFEVHELLSRYMGAGAYVVSRRMAARLATLDPRTAAASIDALLFDPRLHPFPGMRAHQLLPAVAIQDARSAMHDPDRFSSDTDADIRAARAERDRRRGRLRAATREWRHAFHRWRSDRTMDLRHGFGRAMRMSVPFDRDTPL